MTPNRILMAMAMVFLLVQIVSMLFMERVNTGLGNTIRYRYYYSDNGTGPFIEGTVTIDNLVISVPDDNTNRIQHQRR